MARVWTRMLTAIALSMAAFGCQNKVFDENQALRRQNQELQSQLDTNHSRPEPAQSVVVQQPQPAPVVAQAQPVVEEPEAPAERPRARRPRPDLGDLEVTEDRAAGTTTVSLPGDLFFDSGRATLRENAKKSLDKVVAALKKDYANKHVRIEGHTDSDPIVHSKWKSNKELSEKRALAVEEYLVSRGLPSSRFAIVGLGDSKPRSTSDKAKNRRVEVVVLTRAE